MTLSRASHGNDVALAGKELLDDALTVSNRSHEHMGPVASAKGDRPRRKGNEDQSVSQFNFWRLLTENRRLNFTQHMPTSPRTHSPSGGISGASAASVNTAFLTDRAGFPSAAKGAVIPLAAPTPSNDNDDWSEAA